MKIRPYRMTKRAESQRQTRLRITKSIVELHGRLGPSRTSISAIAEHAGVRRSTVYRLFPDETALFEACTSHWLACNPLPDLGRWAAVDNVDERLHVALQELYAYYRSTQRMLANILRDEDAMPIVKQMVGGYRRYLENARETLMRGRRLRKHLRKPVRAALGHAIAFPVWRSLAIEQELDDKESSELMCRLVAGVSTMSGPANAIRR